MDLVLRMNFNMENTRYTVTMEKLSEKYDNLGVGLYLGVGLWEESELVT